MQIINPSTRSLHNIIGTLNIMKSVYKAFNGGLSEAVPVGQDSKGVFNKFVSDNTNGVMLRIGGMNSNETIKWQGGASTSVNHALGRQPIGFKVYDKDKTCDVFREGTPNSSTINLQCTDPTANTTIYIF